MKTPPIYEECNLSQTHKFLIYPYETEGFLLKIQVYSPELQMYLPVEGKDTLTKNLQEALSLGKGLLHCYENHLDFHPKGEEIQEDDWYGIWDEETECYL